MTLPYRDNVVAVIFKKDKFLIDQLIDWKKSWWKFPQGGIEEGETEEEALRRELKEELGINNIRIIGKAKYTNKYDWPKELQIKKGLRWRGQFQKFYVVEFIGKGSEIRPNSEEVRVARWVNSKELSFYFKDMAELCGDYWIVIKNILRDFNL